MRISDFGRVVENIVLDGVEFLILDIPETMYAGILSQADSPDAEPDGEAGCAAFEANMERIAGKVFPSAMMCISIGYNTPGERRALMHCTLTDAAAQPEGIYSRTQPRGLYAAVAATDAAWALTERLTGEKDPVFHMAPLFGLIRAALCGDNGMYGYDTSRDHDIEIYSPEERFVAAPIGLI